MPTEIAALRTQMDEFRKELGEIRRKTDERHVENSKRFDHIEGQLKLMDGVPNTLAAINKTIGDHALLDISTLAQLRTELAANTIATTAVGTSVLAVRDNVAILVAAQVGRGAVKVGITLTKLLVGLGAICVAIVTLYGFYLFVTGRNPFPPAIPKLSLLGLASLC